MLTENDYLKNILKAPVYDVARVTDFQKLKKISTKTKNLVFIKREDQQIVHSFKLRGAYNMLYKIKSSNINGVITASAGNHAQGLALSGKKLNIPVKIVMPNITPEIKINSVKNLDAEVILHGVNFDEAQNYALKLSKEQNLKFIPPFDHPDIITGQGTIGLEIFQQNSHLNYIFIPVGGGGLISGIAILIKQLIPDIKIIAIESEESPCLYEALKTGKPKSLNHVGRFADGVAVKKIGTETFRICKDYVDDIILVNSDEICSAIKDIFEDTRAISEPSGAMGLAGIKKYISLHNIENKSFATILTGANLNFNSLRYISERSEIGEQKEALFAVKIPEKVGEFLKLYNKLKGRNITEFNYRFNNSKNANILIGIRLSSGLDEIKEIQKDLKDACYDAFNLSNDEIAKQHIKYMIGGKTKENIEELLFSFEFPEYPGALRIFLNHLIKGTNITLFNYRNQGSDYGKVLCGFDVKHTDKKELLNYLKNLNYKFTNVSNNKAFKVFL
ncbi:threonine ammonia-lyase, biosynthetic [Paraphotobacterium marinum]|uniref:L-threonine dehydratase n=1 Tax=Paraphotobacterium marinum TaxID=1755811 RepID=A0A220VD65_9GAMM|nr:threonine ammonia-lyase, biosynthetic [Paraphotobacterium marinum]ASK78122.1 threonine ammonia-lyase, biosynthetic [Paraphotobacterium marinum]